MWAALRFLLVVEVISLLALPLTARAFARLPGLGLGFAKPLGLLLVAYPAWLLASLHVIGFGVPSALLGLAVVGVGGAWLWRGGRPALDAATRRAWIGAEATFALTFALGALLAAYSADVRQTEKPMDMAILASIGSSGSFPPHDPWLSGFDLNYYYVGHYLMAFVVRLTGVEPSVGYNLSLALLFALVCTAAFALGSSLAAAGGSRRPLAIGVAAAALLAAAGTIDAAQQLFVDAGPLRLYDWFAPSRLVEGAITEFPAFSFLLGDLHAHVLAIPWTLVALGFGLQAAIAGPRRADLLAGGLTVGALYAINAWSFPVTLGVVVLATVVWLRDPALPSSPRVAALWVAGVLGVAVLAFAPYWIVYDPPAGRLALVTGRDHLPTLLGSLALFFGVFAWIIGAGFVGELLGTRRPRKVALLASGAVILLALLVPRAAGPIVLLAGIVVALRAATSRPAAAERYAWLLAAAGLGCLWLREIVYVRDEFDGSQLERMNTVFKLDYQAWLLFAVAAAGSLTWAHRRLPTGAWRPWGAVVVVLGVLAAVYPIAGTYSRKEAFSDGPRLTGLRWLARDAPGDVGAIGWLRAHTPGDAVVLEAVGPDYSEFGHARISTFSGRPTVLGWPGHELQWGHAVGTRKQDVATAYSSGNPAVVGPILQRYRVDYVVAGTLERNDYGSAGLAALDAVGRRVYSAGGTVVWRVTRSDRT